MRILPMSIATIGLLLASVRPGLADPIPGLFNTGVDDTGTPLADNAVDPHYQLVAPSNITGDAIVATSAGGFPIGPWLEDNGLSAWITPSEDTNGPGDFDGSPSFYYQTSFDLAGFDPSTAMISGSWSSDNLGLDILLNGNSTGFDNPAQFGGATPFTLAAADGHPFQAGVNTLQFVLNNGGGEGNPDGPTGVRVEMTGSALVPEPSTAVLAGLGVL